MTEPKLVSGLIRENEL